MSAVFSPRVDDRPLDCRGREHRVLFLADHLGTDGGGVHGVTTYLLDVLPALAASGMTVGACFLRHEHPAASVLRAGGIPVRFLGTRRHDPFVLGRIEQLVRDGRYGILHCTQFRASIVGRWVAHRFGNLRLVLHVHDLNVPPPPMRWLNCALARPTDRGIGVSEAARELAVNGYYVPRERVRVLHTGVDERVFRHRAPEEREAIRRELGLDAAAPVLCLVARFDAVKGQRAMLRMLATLTRRRPDVVLLLIGDGPERRACERLAAMLGLSSRVRFLGQRADVARMVAAADVAVVPSRSEGLSRAAIEANLCGVPCVAYDVGGLAEALPDAACGELVPAGAEDAFVAALERALAADAGTAAARAEIARARFGLIAHTRALRACYDEWDARELCV